MTITLTEMPSSRQSTLYPPSLTWHGTLTGTQDETAAIVYADTLTTNAFTHATGLLYKQDVKLEPIGYEMWHVEVPYGPKVKGAGTWDLQIDNSGGTVRVYAGTRIAGFPAGCPDNKGLIGKNGDEYEGVEVPIPASKVIVEYRNPRAFLVPSRVFAIEDLVGTYNSDTFLGRAPGTMAYQGGQYRTGSDTETTARYTFSYSRNMTNETIGGITGVSKKGWEVASPVIVADASNSKNEHKVSYIEIVQVLKPAAYATVFGFGGS